MTTERDAFDQALKALMVAEGCVDDGQIITSYIVIGSAIGADDHRTGYFRDYQGGEQAWHTTLGLIEVARVQLADEMLHADEDDEP